MKLPLLNAKQLSKILDKIGFEFLRQKGSHMFFRHPDGRTTVIPNHPNDKIDLSLLNKIIKKDLKLNKEDFSELVKKILIL